jgi:hypothetical protein
VLSSRYPVSVGDARRGNGAVEKVDTTMRERLRPRDVEHPETRARAPLVRRVRDAGQHDALADVELTEPEAKLLCDALNGCWMLDVVTPSQARTHLLMEAEDHVRLNGASKKWGVDWDHLRSTLADLSPVQCLAVMDAVERFWCDDEATVESVGLVHHLDEQPPDE